MSVPLVVQMTLDMIADIATLGPANQSHQVSPKKDPFMKPGGLSTPNTPRRLWKVPREFPNQLTFLPGKIAFASPST